MALLEIKNLKKHFDDLAVLNDISMKVEEGEVVAILGPSGSGKSTLLRCATMLETMDAGEMSYDGVPAVVSDVDGKAVQVKGKQLQEVMMKYGLVFQNFNLFPHYTVLKNVTDGPVAIQKKDKSEVEETAKKLLKKVGLDGKEDYYPFQLSGGQQQRVAIARALAMEPKILFFDEPTSALDPEITAGILQLMKELAQEKMTMVIVTHEIEFAKNVANRIVFMDGGYIVEEGSPEQVIDNPKNERTKTFLQKMSK